MDKLFLSNLYFNPTMLHWALQAQPELWNTNTARTEGEKSPHREMDDIWVRYANDLKKAGGPHQSAWYSVAEKLPVRDIIKGVMIATNAVELGGVLITRVPPGKKCHPHTDEGWHAEYYDKWAFQITSAPGQKFCVEEMSIEPMPGQVFRFVNQHEHWVENPTPYERITMIICLRQ